MATPTERVTRNAQSFLGGHPDVALAMRVTWGPNAISNARKFGTGFWVQASLWVPLLMPVIALWRLPEIIRMRNDPDAEFGILVLTADEGRLLLSTSARRSDAPTGLVALLPPGSALEVDVDLMSTELIPSLTVAEREFVVNGTDFRALLKAIEQHKVKSPEIRASLPALRAVGKSPYG